MFTEKIAELPLFDLAQLNRSSINPEPDPWRRPEWKHRCELLLRYLQSHDLSRMPEALHQRLYIVLNEIAKVLGDNLTDKLSQHPRKWSETNYNLDEAAKSFMFRESLPFVSNGTDRQLSIFSPLSLVDSNTRSLRIEEAIQTSCELSFGQKQSSSELTQQLVHKDQQLIEKQKELTELRELYKEAILESERYMIDEYTAKQELNSELERLRLEVCENQKQIGKLRARVQLPRISSDLLRSELLQNYFEQRQENLDEETMTIHSSRPEAEKTEEAKLRARRLAAKSSTRRPSVSVESGQQTDLTQFESEEGSEDSIRHHQSNKIALLQKRLQEVENELRIKDDVVSAISSFIEKESDALGGERHNLKEILRRCELKQKYKGYCSLAEENAYLKQCMDKLTRSEEFWSKLQEGEQELIEDNRKKCLIF